MSAPSAPVIPPRPARSPQTLAPDVPSIPARPINRRLERSVSPGRDSYAPSPLNDRPGSAAGISRTVSNDLPARPPSVTIPSLGEEGIEYDEVSIPTETRNVGSDLKLHAPKPSLPTSSAKAQVQTVTRTDSSQAAAAGFGKAPSPALEDADERSRSLHSKPSASRGESSRASSNRRQSLQYDEEHGIPEIGQRVPMLAYAGDVQAPSPAPPRSASASGSRSGRHHHRTRSGRDVFLPPGSYGLHGHGLHGHSVQSIDKFEKAWYEKHPDEYAREEQGQYGPAIAPRPDWALSSDDLNRIVRSSTGKESSVGASPVVTGTPEEEVGYLATDEYTRLDTQPVAESPLRQTSFPTAELRRTRSVQSAASSDAGGRTIHINDPYHSSHHPDGFAQTPDLTTSHDFEDDLEYDDAPILASDEVRPESAHLHPAISPRRSSTDFHELDRFQSRTPSAPNSRPSSLHGAPTGLARWNSRGEEADEIHTPLEDVEEYEPLFPDDGKPVSAAERFKKRSELKQRFPSQDIWEDTPDSLQLHASVSTPDLPEQPSSKFETPEVEERRRKQTEQIDSHKVASHILRSHGQAPHQGRPDTLKHRFPSQDIWEDAPESHQLVTTVEPAGEEVKSPDTAQPAIPARPSIPARPQRAKPDISLDEKKAPTIPGRPKPTVHTRLSKPASRDVPENGAAVPANKSKPAVPARPAAGKIAGLKANFLSDLNSRLQVGPQGPKPSEKKEEEVLEEKTPLPDARKSRARGPARRKPAVTKEVKLPSIPEIRIMDAWNVWEVGVDGHLSVGIPEKSAVYVEEKPITADINLDSAENTMAPAIAKNVAGESVDPTPLSAKESQAADVTTAPRHDDNTASEETSPQNFTPEEAPQTEPVADSTPQAVSADSSSSKEIDGAAESKMSTNKTLSEQAIEKLAAAADGKKPFDESAEE
ncbi:altered inheritance of mitochondria protein 21 [Talaromyces proteolyticus]|uniref:Altered inheritance of mitochondria protein 21 n=1 Tax=Talaromyces proteolyticus TaxID=1131652 RepID=A0AAD4KMJ2_9EURO|nr:altered inheritance of mitochondria protein 21 [Talaromyces proteolyticus]KAH8694914.1 altered inheritance of mitochondria protein 21 [Talaromyces proteolyticus]